MRPIICLILFFVRDRVGVSPPPPCIRPYIDATLQVAWSQSYFSVSTSINGQGFSFVICRSSPEPSWFNTECYRIKWKFSNSSFMLYARYAWIVFYVLRCNKCKFNILLQPRKYVLQFINKLEFMCKKHFLGRVANPFPAFWSDPDSDLVADLISWRTLCCTGRRRQCAWGWDRPAPRCAPDGLRPGCSPFQSEAQTSSPLKRIINKCHINNSLGCRRFRSKAKTRCSAYL